MNKEMSMSNQRQSYSPPELFPLGTLRTITESRDDEDVTGGFDSPATIDIDIDLNNQI